MKLLRIYKGMNRVSVALVAVAVIAVVAAGCWFGYKSRNDFVEVGVSDTSIGDTPSLVESMREIGQWEFLALNDEELVDTVRKGFFSDDELVRIYYGTLRIGLDFSLCDDDWICTEGDSVVLQLPPVKLLDEDFLDEARSRSFHESGKWSSADRQALADRARRKMRERCLTKQNLQLAQKNAEQQVRTLVNMLRRHSER